MTALTSDRDTRFRETLYREPPVKGNVVLYAGAMVALDANGYAVPASATSTLIVIGRAEARYDNTDGADGAIRARVRRGCFSYNNSTSTDAFTAADVGKTAYAADDNTVAKTNGTNTRPVAGTVFDVDALGVWVTFA